MNTALAAVLGGGVGAGLALLLIAIFGRRRQPSPSVGLGGNKGGAAARRRALVSGGLGLVVGVTRWPVAALLALLLAWWWPALFGAKQTARQAIARINAVAAWAEMLRGMMAAAAASIEQAIVATVALAPEPIRADLETLAQRLRQGQPLAIALRPLADAIDDDTGDLVVGALILAADPNQRSGNLADQLGQLAATARAKASMRSRVQADRARLHAAARTITLITIGVISTLTLVGHSFLTPYGTPTDQLALLGVGAVFAVGLAGLTWLGRHGRPERFITAHRTTAEGGRGG
jgi:hypothetical protein